MATILLLEVERTNGPLFANVLTERGYAVMTVDSAQQALESTQQAPPDVLVLNMASLKTSGARICRALRLLAPQTPIVLIAEKKNLPDEQCGATHVLVTPFTPRKLFNCITRLLPGDDSTAIHFGPLKINLAQRRLASGGGHEEKITPKQAKLLEMFLRAPGQVFTRKQILKYVWDTDYTGDTRTLDVHISWLRRVLEPNPRKPRYLKTIRSEGYRLDLPPAEK